MPQSFLDNLDEFTSDQTFGLIGLDDVLDRVKSEIGPIEPPSPKEFRLSQEIANWRPITSGNENSLEHVPLVGGFLGAARLSTVRNAAKRYDAGEATDADYSHLGQYLAEEEAFSDQSWGMHRLHNLLGGAKLISEMIATGGASLPAGAAAKEAITAAVTKAIGAGLTAKVAGATAWAGTVAGVDTALNPGAIASGVAERQAPTFDPSRMDFTLPDESLGASAAKAAGRQFLSQGVERVGGEAISQLWGVRHLRDAVGAIWGKAFGKSSREVAQALATRSGFNGIVAELGEERVDEILAGLTGLEDNYGLTGHVAATGAESYQKGSLEPIQREGGRLAAAAGNEIVDTIGQAALLGGAHVAASAASNPSAALEPLRRVTASAIEKISRGEPLSRRDVNGQTSRQERVDLESSIRSTMAAEADRIIKERPDAAHRLVNIAVQDRPTARASDYRQAFGEEEPHPGYAQLLLDQLRPRAEEIAAAALQKRQAEYEQEQAKGVVENEQVDSGSDSEPKINDLRRELTRAGIPKAKNATKEELADLHKSWTDELQKQADENEVGVDRVQHWLGVLYDREDQLTGQYDYEIGGLLSEYRKRYGLNAQAMSKTDPGGSFSGRPFSDIANEFISETQGRFDVKSTEDVWELFKDGKLHRPTYRDLLPEAIEQAKAEADEFDPEAFGLPAAKPEKSRELKSGGDATAWDFDADVPLGGDPAAIVGEPPKLDLAGVRMMVRENPNEDFSPEGIASWIKQAAAPEMLTNYEKAVRKLDRWADKNADPDDDNPNINGEHFEDHASRMLYAWMPSPQELAQAISEEAAKFQAEQQAKRAAKRPSSFSDKVGNAEGRGGGDDDGDGQPFGSPAETQAHPSVAKSASQLPWQYQGERIRKPQDSPAIIRQLVKATESLGRALPVRVGRLGRRMGRRAAGWYNPKTHVTRVKLALDTATASHEVGHAVDRLLFGPRKRWPKNAVPPAVHADLVKLGQALYPKEPHNGWESEGFAELVFLFVHDKSKLDTVPALRDWFQAEVLDANPEFAKRLEAASKMGHKWVQQGSTNRTSASMVDTGFGTGVQNLKRLYDQNRPYEVLVEALAPLDELSKAAAEILGEKGKELPASKDPFKLAKRLRLTAPAITRAMIDEGMVDRTGKIVGPSLRAGVRKIKRAEYRDFARYLFARRAIKVQASGRQAGISKKDAEQTVRDLENDRFKDAAEAVYKWTDGVLDYMASLSPDLAAGVEAIRAIDPGDYVPLQRWFEEFDETYRTSSVGSTASGNVTKRLRGSGRRVINPIESLISTTQERIEHAHQRAILESVLNTGLGVEMLGEFVEEVEPTKVPKASATLQSLLEKIRAHAGKFVDVPRGAEFKLIGKDGEEIDIEDALEEWITFWGQADNPTGPDPIFAVRKGGKVRWFYIKPRLAEALGQIQEAKFRNPVGQAIFNFIRTSNLVFKMGTTGLRAPFGVVINPIRDVQDLYQRTRSDASFARVAGNYLRAYFEELASRVSGRAVESRESQLFRRLGLEMSQHLGRERAATRRASKGLFRTITPGKAFDYLIDLLQFSDAAARIAEIRMVAKDKGIDLDALTFDQAIDLAIAAKEATTDFSAGGRWTSFLNGLLPYFNAGVQGWAGGIRAAKRNPMRTLWRVGWKAGILAALWLQYKDDDWWKEMPSYEKWSYFHIPIKFGGRDEVLRIPVPQDTENVYTMGVLAILEAVNERDPGVALEYAQHLADTVTPTAPVILQEGAEQAANRDFFTGKPIVSEKFRDTRPSEQFNEYTSGLAKWLGENTGLSPVRIDHAIRGVGGPLTSDATRALTSDDREGEPADTPVVGTLFQRGGRLGYRPESVDQLYDRLQEANFRHTDWRNATTPQEKAAAENEQQRQARLMLEDATQAVTDLSRARSMTKSVTDRRKITAKMAEIARDAIANYDAATPNRERFKQEAKAAERVREMAGAR